MILNWASILATTYSVPFPDEVRIQEHLFRERLILNVANLRYELAI